MTDLVVLSGYCTIPVYRKVGGSNRIPASIQWEICGNTLVDECNFQYLSRERWLAYKSYVYRHERDGNGKLIKVYVAREVLGLPRDSGRGGDEADHRNHDTFDNTLGNLRIATGVQNSRNRRPRRSSQRFKGVRQRDTQTKTYQALVFLGGVTILFKVVSSEIEAGLMYHYAASAIYGEFYYPNIIPENEMPSLERQWELFEVVKDRLAREGIHIEG